MWDILLFISSRTPDREGNRPVDKESYSKNCICGWLGLGAHPESPCYIWNPPPVTQHIVSHLITEHLGLYSAHYCRTQSVLDWVHSVLESRMEHWWYILYTRAAYVPINNNDFSLKVIKPGETYSCLRLPLVSNFPLMLFIYLFSGGISVSDRITSNGTTMKNWWETTWLLSNLSDGVTEESDENLSYKFEPGIFGIQVESATAWSKLLRH